MSVRPRPAAYCFKIFKILKYNYKLMDDDIKFPQGIKRYDSVFWVEINKIKPNPMQPRQDFDEERLKDLASSIRQYGVLQPLVVSRKEIETDRGRAVEYELITGERRLRAAQMAGLYQVPVIIRDTTDERVKLELSIIENLQREDLNPIEKASAFKKLADEFNLKHHEIALQMGKSREYVSNTIRLLALPVEMQTALINEEITEGHCRPLLMLVNNEEKRGELFKEILEKKISVRKAEKFSRDIVKGPLEKIMESEPIPEDPEIKDIEEKLISGLGLNAVVRVEKEGDRRKVHIEFLSNEELESFLERLLREKIEEKQEVESAIEEAVEEVAEETAAEEATQEITPPSPLDTI